MNELKEGMTAPLFESQDQDGKTFRLKDHLGKKIILFFYPKDDTEACTKEACNLKDNYKALLSAGFTVIGISVDEEQSHQKFIAKYNLPFLLLADTTREVVEKYGVWKEKTMFGNKFWGIVRTTFLIDQQGKIRKIIRKVKTEDHAAQILEIQF